MPYEITVLALATLLAVVQLFLYAAPANIMLGSRYLAGPRDEGRTLSGVPARLQRAFQNHMEGLVLHMAATVVVVLGEATGPLTQACATIYLIARLAYVPAYASGVVYVRSAIWGVGFFATLTMLVSALL